MRLLLAALLFGVAASRLPADAAPPGNDEITAVLHTDVGDVTIRFFVDRAPNHVKNFVNLAGDGFYDGTLFHRVIPGFVLQGGDPLTKDRNNTLTWGNGGQVDAAGQKIRLKPEFNETPHKRGVVSMARSAAPDSASSQFFIVLKDYPSLDHQYTAFGEVVKGMDVVDRVVTESNPDASNANLGRPRRYISLTTVDILRNGRKISRTQSLQDIERPPSPSPTPSSGTSDSSGTGFLVSGQGDILTNRHVVVGCRLIRAGKWVATLVAQNDNSDLALLRIPSSEGTPHATFRDSPAIRPGDPVTAIGYPLPGLLAPEQNISTGTVSALAGPNNDRRILQVSAPIQPGNSGGPVLDSSAHVVGVMMSTLSTVRGTCQ
jgi:peptidyl-prolyl cis-trans isomerase B (cyclophilin B)